VSDLTSQFEKTKDAIRNRLEEFSRVPSSEYYYELAYCLLTPQSSAVNAGKVVERLKAIDLLNRPRDPAPILRSTNSYIRFHNTKAKHLLDARLQMETIREILSNGFTNLEMREWLVKNVKGLGWKEASHFLRNIGHRNLAILDRHILRNLKKHGAIRSTPKSLTQREYLRIEQRFMRFAESVGISMDELDLLFWSMETGAILK
jgi:N-glycosylase/DNA lyase